MINLECFSAKYFSSPGIVEFVSTPLRNGKAKSIKCLCFGEFFLCCGNHYERNFSHKCVFARNFTFNYKMINFPNIYMLGMLLYVI